MCAGDLRRRAAWLAAISLMFFGIAVHADALPHPNPATGRYEGDVPRDPRSDIDLKVDKGFHQGPADGSFGANFTVICSDGKERRGGSYVPIGFPTGGRRFAGREVRHEGNGDMSVSKVRGRIKASGMAKGWLSNVVDRSDPPDPGFPDLPDCATDGKLKWRAKFDHPLLRPPDPFE